MICNCADRVRANLRCFASMLRKGDWTVKHFIAFFALSLNFGTVCLASQTDVAYGEHYTNTNSKSEPEETFYYYNHILKKGQLEKPFELDTYE